LSHSGGGTDAETVSIVIVFIDMELLEEAIECSAKTLAG